jgi:BirA family biotin operon repressor/biotin-[acetyl-CoA-carboxylase] ligase
MDTKTKNKLSALIAPGRFEYYQSISSTNQVAHQWIQEGTPNFSLIAANEQTQGRGRNNRTWFTPPDSALAFSLIFTENLTEEMVFYTGLGAIAICRALEQDTNLSPQIKWPNDILINEKKVSGILVESSWLGSTPQAIIIGIGINITSKSIPPAGQLLFPAAAVESFTKSSVDRFTLLEKIIRQTKDHLEHLSLPQMVQEWNDRLAFKNRRVFLQTLDGINLDGILIGIDEQGKLMLELESGTIKHIASNEIHLRPL